MNKVVYQIGYQYQQTFVIKLSVIGISISGKFHINASVNLVFNLTEELRSVGGENKSHTGQTTTFR